MRGLIAVVLAGLLAGCASTSITGYSDPDYRDSQYDSVVVVAEGAGLERAARLEGGICEKFQSKGITCAPFNQMFPPTRSHPADEVFTALNHKDIGALVVLLSGADQSSARNIGYQTFGSANVYGNQVTGQSSSMALTAFSRQAHARIVLVDADTRETAWLGDARTEGSGAVNVTESAFASSLTTEVVRALVESPHFSGE
ncbi:hypothetical protein ACFOZ5_08535 [Marinobacter lacisalsi]|uniref:DUF4136 domain-containing protein n=1 Tax=Marinobacter lacisalsi TaxID=475979 RepID=A0ABV8QH45_9GAMM